MSVSPSRAPDVSSGIARVACARDRSRPVQLTCHALTYRCAPPLTLHRTRALASAWACVHGGGRVILVVLVRERQRRRAREAPRLRRRLGRGGGCRGCRRSTHRGQARLAARGCCRLRRRRRRSRQTRRRGGGGTTRAVSEAGTQRRPQAADTRHRLGVCADMCVLCPASQTQALLHRYLETLLDTSGGADEAQAVPPAADGDGSGSEGGGGFRVFSRVARGAPVVAAGTPVLLKWSCCDAASHALSGSQACCTRAARPGLHCRRPRRCARRDRAGATRQTATTRTRCAQLQPCFQRVGYSFAMSRERFVSRALRPAPGFSRLCARAQRTARARDMAVAGDAVAAAAAAAAERAARRFEADAAAAAAARAAAGSSDSEDADAGGDAADVAAAAAARRKARRKEKKRALAAAAAAEAGVAPADDNMVAGGASDAADGEAAKRTVAAEAAEEKLSQRERKRRNREAAAAAAAAAAAGDAGIAEAGPGDEDEEERRRRKKEKKRMKREKRDASSS